MTAAIIDRYNLIHVASEFNKKYPSEELKSAMTTVKFAYDYVDVRHGKNSFHADITTEGGDVCSLALHMVGDYLSIDMKNGDVSYRHRMPFKDIFPKCDIKKVRL